MNQKDLSGYTDLVTELDDRTKSNQVGYNSIDELATKVKTIESESSYSPLAWLEITADYTLTIDDIGKILFNTSGNDYVITIPDNASVDFGEDVAFTFMQENTGKLQVKGANGVTLVTNETKTPFKPMTYARRGVDNWVCMGEFNSYTVSVNIYNESNALSATNDSNSVNNIGDGGSPVNITSVSNGNGTYSVRATANASGIIRMSFNFPVINGETYNLTFKGFGSLSNEMFLNVGVTNVNIDSDISFTTTETEYTRSLTATASGVATLRVDMYNASVGDYIQLDDVLITLN